MDTNRMKKLFGLVFLFCAATVFAANPSLYVPWTAMLGSNGVAMVTNPASGRVIISAPNANTWTNSAGIIRPVSTNAVRIYPHGTILVGTNSLGWIGSVGDGDTLISMRDTSKGENGFNQVIIGTTDGTAETYLSLVAGSSDWQLDAYNQDVSMMTLHPTAADGTTPYTWNTVELHSGHLFKISTAQQTRFKLSALGGLAMGTTNNSSATISADIDGAIAIGQANDADSSISSGGPGGFSAGQALGGAYIEAGTASLAIGVVDGGGNFGSAFLSASPDTIGASFVFGTATNGSIVANGQGALAGGVASNGVVSADGLAGFTWGENVGNSGNNAYAFGKQFTNSTANTFNVGWGAAHFIVNPTNGVSTPLITVYGAVARPWQLGSASNATSVAFPGFTATNVVEVVINGVAYLIPAKIKQ